MLTAPLVHADSLNTHDSVVFSPDGSRLATVAGNAAQIWYAATGRAATDLLRHRALIQGAHFSPDGTKLLTASEDESARLWDTETGYAVSERLEHGSRVCSAEFSPDGSQVLTCSADRQVRIWEVTSAPLPVPSWIPQLAEALVGQRIDAQEVSGAVSVEKLYELRHQLAANTNQTYYGRWAHWFFADGATRTISPLSDLTVPEYVRRRIAENDVESLHTATVLSPTNAMAFARFAEQLFPTDEGASDRAALFFNRHPRVIRMRDADWFSRYATNLAPPDPEIRLIRESVAENLSVHGFTLSSRYKKWGMP